MVGGVEVLFDRDEEWGCGQRGPPCG
jgi:hypothetical protein